MIDRNKYNTYSKTEQVHKKIHYPLLKIDLSMIYKHYYHKDKTGFGVFYMSVINTTHQ